MFVNVRRLAALDMYGTSGSARWRRLIRAEFIIGVVGCGLLGVLTLASGSGWTILLGIWLVATGMNYVPLAISAQALSRPGALEAELVGVNLPRELRQAGVRQLWMLVLFAVVVAAIARRLGAVTVRAWGIVRLRRPPYWRFLLPAARVLRAPATKLEVRADWAADPRVDPAAIPNPAAPHQYSPSPPCSPSQSWRRRF